MDDAKKELKKQVVAQKLKGNFVENQSVKKGQMYALFKTGVLTQDKEGHRVVRCDFSIVMDDTKAELLQISCADIVAEWKQMLAEGLIERVELDGERLPVQVVECRMWPERAAAFRQVSRLERVKMTKLRTKARTYVELRVSVTRGIDDEAWAWLRANYGSSLWLKLQKAQGDLLETFLEEEAEEDQSETENDAPAEKSKPN